MNNNNFENLYNVLKTFLPVADKYLVNSPLEPYIPQIQNIVNLIESVGGIQTVNNLVSSLSKNKNSLTNTKIQPFTSIENKTNQNNNNNNLKNKKKINDYNRIT